MSANRTVRGLGGLLGVEGVGGGSVYGIGAWPPFLSQQTPTPAPTRPITVSLSLFSATNFPPLPLLQNLRIHIESSRKTLLFFSLLGNKGRVKGG